MSSRPIRLEPDDAPLAGRGAALALQTRDFDELVLALRTWEADFRQLSRGTFSGGLQVVRAGAVEILRVTSNQALLARGRQRLPSVLFNLVLPGSEETCWRGRHLRPGQINVLGPWDAIDHRTSAPYEALALNVDLGRLLAAAGPHSFDPEDWLRRHQAFTPPRAAYERLERFLRHLVPATNATGQAPYAPTLARWVEQECLSRLLACLAGAQPAPKGTGRVLVRQQALTRAEEHMWANLGLPLTVGDLCAVTDVSQRSLEYAFRDQFGLTPMAYYKTLRLNAVRHELKRASAGELAIHEAAHRWGFWHTGSFAADYQRLFGELPSETQRQGLAASHLD